MAFVANTVHSLSLNGLVFVANGQAVKYTDPSGETYFFDISDTDTQWGNAVPITTTLLTLLTDGSQVTHERDDNREPSIALTVKATGPNALEAAEVALRKAVGEPGELRWQPPSPGAAVTVFDVTWSVLKHRMDSFGERYLRRLWTIELEALPHARSATKIITPAVTTVAPTVVDTGSATTNWTAPSPAGATVSVVSGAVTSTYDPDGGPGPYYGTVLQRAFPSALNVSANKYLAIDWKSQLPAAFGLGNINGNPFANLVEVRREPAPAGGFTRSWFRILDATTSLTLFNFAIIHPPTAAVATATLSIDQVLLANALPVSGTARQKMTSIIPGGSVPTEGSLHLSHPTSALGTAMIFTHPAVDGYAPPLRPWRVSSDAVTADPATVSGSYNAITGVASFNVPVSAIPRGEHHLWVRMSASVVGTYQVGFTAQSVMGAFGAGTIQQGAAMLTFPTTTLWYTFCLGRVVLPPTDVGASGLVGIRIQEDPLSGGAGAVYLDEAWTFAMDKGRLTVVDCRSDAPAPGAASNHLWVEAPSVERPNGGLFTGTNPDKSDRFWPGAVLIDQNHRFYPEGTLAFSVTPNALDAQLDLEHYRRWHTHAAD